MTVKEITQYVLISKMNSTLSLETGLNVVPNQSDGLSSFRMALVLALALAIGAIRGWRKLPYKIIIINRIIFINYNLLLRVDYEGWKWNKIFGKVGLYNQNQNQKNHENVQV